MARVWDEYLSKGRAVGGWLKVCGLALGLLGADDGSAAMESGESAVSRDAEEQNRFSEMEKDQLRALMAEFLADEGIGTVGLINGRFFIQSPDKKYRLDIGGRIQPRFTFERREDDDNLSEFRFRRLRLDLRGHVVSPDISFRIMPELRDNARLDTAYINFRLSDTFQLRVGQYNIPFAWERDVSSSRHQLTERSVANNIFQWPGGGGKDVGLTLHGQPVDDIRYGVGVFGGQGRNLAGEETDGVMLSGRATWSPLGTYPNTETLVQPVEGTNLSFGGGAWCANKNAVTDWYQWDEDRQTADAVAATGDAHFQIGRFAAHASGFFRHVAPREAGFSSYDGAGFNVQAGYLIRPDRLFGTLRYAQAAPDIDRREGEAREVTAGLQIFQQGHRLKLHVEAGWEERHDGEGWRDTEFVRIQYQVLY